MITTEIINAIYKTYPQTVSTDSEGIAYDASGNIINYDINLINSEITAKQEAEITAKASAQAKLSALGLTADEVKAILGTA